MKLAWLTDIHLNFLTRDERMIFYQTILDSSCDALLISGDIAEAPSICDLLLEMVHFIKKPIHFVLGNHDYYRGSVVNVRAELIQLMQTTKSLHWLPASGVQLLTSDIVLVGTDGFADGRYGNYQNSHVCLNDSVLIEELFQHKLLSKKQLQMKMQEFADEDAKQLEHDIQTAIDVYKPKKLIVLTHIPPFPEVCMHQGHPTHADYLPYFSSKATGDVLLKTARNHPSVDFSVLAGHTHSYAQSQILKNLKATVGSSEYYKPSLQQLIDLNN
jgi:Icc-related predicted phosphoesterase